MGSFRSLLLLATCILLSVNYSSSQQRRVGKLQEVFAWKQLTYNIFGNHLIQDRFGEVDDAVGRVRRQVERRFGTDLPYEPKQGRPGRRPGATTTAPATTVRPRDEVGRFFIQYNNVPMGLERVGNRLFIANPRRRYGIPATLNYIDLTRDANTRSPALRPYPDMQRSRSIISVYRTRADVCGRLWMVDTGLLELPDEPRQLQTPSILIFELSSDRQIRKYQLTSADVPAANTPTGLASITVDVDANDCDNAFAYIPDLTTNGIVVYSYRENSSWRLTHNFVHFNPLASTITSSGHRFQWNDGIFSITLSPPASNGCRVAYSHPLVSFQEFTVSTCVLKNRTASSDSNFWTTFNLLGERGEGSQCTMHDFDRESSTIFFADIGRSALSCWNTNQELVPSNIAVLAQDENLLPYPSDLHVTDGEVWLMANSLPRFGYSRLDPNEYNFFVYKGNVRDLISGTVCDGSRSG